MRIVIVGQPHPLVASPVSVQDILSAVNGEVFHLLPLREGGLLDLPGTCRRIQEINSEVVILDYDGENTPNPQLFDPLAFERFLQPWAGNPPHLILFYGTVRPDGVARSRWVLRSNHTSQDARFLLTAVQSLLPSAFVPHHG